MKVSWVLIRGGQFCPRRSGLPSRLGAFPAEAHPIQLPSYLRGLTDSFLRFIHLENKTNIIKL